MNFNPDLTPPEDNKITPPVTSSNKQEVLPTEKHDVLSMPALNKPSFINAGIFILLASVALLIR